MKKRIITTTMLLVIGITLFYSCTKLVDATTLATSLTVSVPTTVLLAGDPVFSGLFDALNHFDPHYLQLVYKDQRTTEEIISKGKNLVDQLKKYPTNMELQQQLADLYTCTLQYKACILRKNGH